MRSSAPTTTSRASTRRAQCWTRGARSPASPRARRGCSSARSSRRSRSAIPPSSLRKSLMAPCVVGRDERELRESARRVGARFGRDPQEVLDRYGPYGPVGTVEQVVERLKQTAELGYERVMLQHLAHADLDTVALIGRELAPAVA